MGSGVVTRVVRTIYVSAPLVVAAIVCFMSGFVFPDGGNYLLLVAAIVFDAVIVALAMAVSCTRAEH